MCTLNLPRSCRSLSMSLGTSVLFPHVLSVWVMPQARPPRRTHRTRIQPSFMAVVHYGERMERRSKEHKGHLDQGWGGRACARTQSSSPQGVLNPSAPERHNPWEEPPAQGQRSRSPGSGALRSCRQIMRRLGTRCVYTKDSSSSW